MTSESNPSPKPKSTHSSIKSGVDIHADGNVVVKGDVAGRDNNKFFSYSFDGDHAAKNRRNQLVLLSKVKEYWIKGVYEKSIHSDILLTLEKELDPKQVQQHNPWGMILETPEKGKQIISPEKSIAEIFDELHHAMLILGTPGSGKTFTLLALAREAIARAEADPLQPIPVILNLSSWAERRFSIDLWLIEELFYKYQIPRKISREWVKDDALLLLLDGLDEVAESYRVACVGALNRFRTEHGLMPLAMCSRQEEYQALRVQLKLEGAIQIQPLTFEQVDDYLHQTRVEELRTDIKTDSELLNMMQSPLMLSIASVAYHELSEDMKRAMPALSVEKRRTTLFQSYVKAMFRRNARTNQQIFKPEEITTKVAYLAKQMLAYGQSTFLVEELQPIWLSRGGRWLYVNLSRLIVGVFLWVAFCLLPAIFINSFNLHNYYSFLSPEYLKAYLGNVFGVFNIYFVLAMSLIVFMSTLWFSVLGWIRFEKSATLNQPMAERKKLSKKTLNLVASLALIGCPALCVGTLMGAANSGNDLMQGFIFAILVILPMIIVTGLVFSLRDVGTHPNNDIPLVEMVNWSWKRGLKGFATAIVISSPLALILVVIMGVYSYYSASSTGTFNMQPEATAPLLKLVSMCISSISLPIGVFFGIFNGFREAHILLRSEINQGINRSFKTAVRSALIFGVYGFMSLLLFIWIWSIDPRYNLSEFFDTATLVVFTIILVEASSVVGFLLFGGVTVINHYTLRVILTLRNHLPWKISSFFDYCVDRVFMRRIGGGYIFIHRYLMEYFASLSKD